MDVIQKYKNDKNFYFYKNLPRDKFLSIYKNSKLIIGNSSSGIIESASIPVPAINVGLRQKGRLSNGNVIFTDSDRNSISKAIEKALSKNFIYGFNENLYGDGKSAIRAYKIIKNNDFKKFLYKQNDPLNYHAPQ